MVLLSRSWGESEEKQMVSVLVKGHEMWRVSETMRSSLLRVLFVCLKVRGLVVELGPRGERLGIWLVVGWYLHERKCN